MASSSRRHDEAASSPAAQNRDTSEPPSPPQWLKSQCVCADRRLVWPMHAKGAGRSREEGGVLSNLRGARCSQTAASWPNPGSAIKPSVRLANTTGLRVNQQLLAWRRAPKSRHARPSGASFVVIAQRAPFDSVGLATEEEFAVLDRERGGNLLRLDVHAAQAANGLQRGLEAGREVVVVLLQGLADLANELEHLDGLANLLAGVLVEAHGSGADQRREGEL
mmetsp:Transcript_18310/g.69311  ORF Transcript_18310/g.69311 Transcript_18310/m.69311 type:complete len:222 (+) Transcript_18310:463-1128(+)